MQCSRLLAAAILAVAPFSAVSAMAQDANAPVPCGLGMVERQKPLLSNPIQRATFQIAAAAPSGQLRITFVGHATFLLETPEGASLATDWNGTNLPRYTPDIATMNNFHITHYTDFPDPALKHVLRGWKSGGIARHDLKVKDLRVYSVPTNIQTYAGMQTNGNSIFVFDTVNLCLAHLSHLHHDLTREEASRLGRIDVLFVPIDGYVSMSHDEVMSVIEMIKPRLVIVMHWDLFGGPRAFMARVQGIYPVKVHDSNVYTLGREMLPTDTEVMLMRQGP
ncbi:MAG: Zn-dependent hydrolase [Rhodospirillales bacterium]|jgi:L-ascorbate metabolism protein UlaG (beta-lactamase superfamily)|nr:Zn-dependent hydrolase [Rhodospirillales bacterium]